MACYVVVFKPCEKDFSKEYAVMWKTKYTLIASIQMFASIYWSSASVSVSKK